MLRITGSTGEAFSGEADGRLSREFRLIGVVVGMLWLVLAIGLYERTPWATALWPWSDVRLSFIFLSSIAAAIAASAVWVGLTGEPAALTPGALTITVTTAGMAVYLAGRAWRHGEPRLLLPAVVCGAMAAGGAYLVWSSFGRPLRDDRPAPVLARGVLAVICLMLAGVGCALVLQVPHVFPWDLSPQTATIFGLIYIGAACACGYFLVRPYWIFAGGELFGFLAYDLVLFIPYIQMLGNQGSAASGADPYGGLYGSAPGTTGGPNEASLIIYLAVLGVSFLLGLYYLAINPATRVSWRSTQVD